jgi:hypothetical protein
MLKEQMSVVDEHCDGDWSVATWEGSRRALLRQSLKLTVRQRLEALDEFAETNDRMQALRGPGLSSQYAAECKRMWERTPGALEWLRGIAKAAA